MADKQVFNELLKQYLPIISDYAKIVIPSLFTYLATRHSLNKPHKYDIKTKQFDLVYLPLYLLTLQYISDAKGNIKDNLPIYLKKVDKLIYKNYPYVFPKTLKLFHELKIEASKERMNAYFISNFEYQVITDYNSLKKELGYPCDSLFNLIKRLNFWDKILFFVNFICGSLFIFSLANFLLSLFNGKLSELFTSLFTSVTCAFLFYIFRLVKKH